MSPAKGGLLYRSKENRYLSDRRSWEKWGLQALAENPPGHLSRIVPFIRIADDSLAVGGVHCPRCLGTLGSHIYPLPLVHECEAAGTRLEVIDLAIGLSGLVLRVVRVNRNFEFVLGAMPTQVRYVFSSRCQPQFVHGNFVRLG